MATLTATSWHYQPLQNHEGLISTTFNYSAASAAAGSVGDRVMLAKIPNGATIISSTLNFNSGATTNVGSLLLFKGKTASATTTLLHLTLTVTASFVTYTHPFSAAANRIPFKVSLSEDDAVQYANVVFVFQTASNTATTSLEISGFVNYTMQGHV